MKLQKIIFPLLLGALLAGCSPRVDDIFDDTAVVRLENRRAAIMQQLIDSKNGWAMQYFAQADPTSSDTVKHRGYTFIMQFRNDGTVTIGAPVNGTFKTETSMWDVINDNSNVLTFNTFNSIFHYYSNPDPDLGLWGADGVGVGGDYEFMVLEYNESENYQLLKGKKNGCYIRMYPMEEGMEWENYFDQIADMDRLLFEEQAPLDFYFGDTHLTLYNGHQHEFRAFQFGADTLGGGTYYGFITTPKGIYLNGGDFIVGLQHYQLDEEGNKINEYTTDTTLSIPREAFVLSADRTRLVCSTDPDMYMTVDGKTAFVADANSGKPWKIELSAIPAVCEQERVKVNAAISAVVPNSYISKIRWEGAGKNKMAMRVYYVVSGDAGNSYDIYYYTVSESESTITLTADGTHTAGSILHEYGGMDFVRSFDGTYSATLLQGFHPSKGVTLQKTDDANFKLDLTH